jgi:single-strand DNA-binding protein
MAGSFNKVILMGNLTRDPEVRYTASNMAIAKIGLAVNRKYRTADGQMKEDVLFVDCDAFGKTAEAIGKFLTKGRPIFIEGQLRLDQWQDKTSGENRSKLKVVIDTFQFIDSKPGGGGGGRGGDVEASGGYDEMDQGGGGGGGGGGGRPAGGARVVTRPSNAGAAPQPQEIAEEDIPF